MDDDSLYQSWGSPKRPEKTQNSKLKMSKRNSTEKNLPILIRWIGHMVIGMI